MSNFNDYRDFEAQVAVDSGPELAGQSRLQPGTRTPQPLVVIVGATASGKSRLGIELAKYFAGEVINADAMQFYEGMQIGTARVSSAEMQGVDHHLLAHLTLPQDASVAEYQVQARAIAHEIRMRERLPILVGGSGLYVRAVTDVINFPGTDPKIRSTLEARAEEVGIQPLYIELRNKDPEAAAAIEPRNQRRVIRALEVIELTGQKFSANLPTYTYELQPTLQIGLRVERSVLDQRISLRVAEMIEQGLVEEVLTLEAAGLRNGVTASRAIGYQQILEHLDGKISLEAAIDGIIQATQRLVRKQESWFKRDPRIHWIDYQNADQFDQALTEAKSLIEAQIEPARLSA